MAKTIDIDCIGYAVKADVYGEDNDGPIALFLIGRTSRRKKQHYIDFSTRLAGEQNVTSVVFDYSGHGDSPFEFGEMRPAQHFLEVITVFDWVRQTYPNRECIVVGSSYGGFMATQLTKYRQFETLILRAPAMYRPADFYTKAKDEDKDATKAFRKDAEKLASHPLLARASKFTGKSLLIVHENDEFIPCETTDAYAKAFNADVIIIPGLPHSLDDAQPEHVKDYFDKTYDWLFGSTKAR